MTFFCTTILNTGDLKRKIKGKNDNGCSEWMSGEDVRKITGVIPECACCKAIAFVSNLK